MELYLINKIFYYILVNLIIMHLIDRLMVAMGLQLGYHRFWNMFVRHTWNSKTKAAQRTWR